MAPTPSAAAARCGRRYCRRRHPHRLRLCSCKPSSGASAARWKAIKCSSHHLARVMRSAPGGWSSRAATWASQRRGCARPSCSTGARRSSTVKVPSSARAPPQGRAWRLRAARATQGDILGYWAPGHCLTRSSQPPPKSPNPPPLTLRRSCLGPWPALPGLRCQACRAGRASTKSEPARRSVPSCIARREAHLSSRARAASAR